MRWSGVEPCALRDVVSMPDLSRLVTVARGLLPIGAAVAGADPRQSYPLLPGEGLPAAVPTRLAEFSAGRHAARQSLAALGHPARPIPMAQDRAPIWPTGLCGSISHSRTACLAAVMPGQGLGLDLEEDTELDAELWDTVLLPEERAWAEGQPNPGQAAKLVFSAKEAGYKAQYPLSRRLFGFETLSIRISGTRFTATFLRPVPPFATGFALMGRHALDQHHILTAVTL